MDIENNNEYIRVFNFKELISEKNQETLKKLGHKIENRKYSERELYDIMYDVVQNYSPNGENNATVEENCKEKGVEVEQCKSLLHNIDHIERKYILSHKIDNIEEKEAQKMLKESICLLSEVIKEIIFSNNKNIEKNHYFDSITQILNLDLFEAEQCKKEIIALCSSRDINNIDIEKIIYKYLISK